MNSTFNQRQEHFLGFALESLGDVWKRLIFKISPNDFVHVQTCLRTRAQGRCLSDTDVQTNHKEP